MTFYAQQMLAGKPKTFRLQYGIWPDAAISLLFGLMFYGSMTVFPHVSEWKLLFTNLAISFVIQIATMPLRVRMWLTWYRTLDPREKGEFWWIKKHQIMYVCIVMGAAVAFTAFLVVGGLMGWLA